jgi:hypothetical protein
MHRPRLIFLTAKAEKLDVCAGMNLGADDYITSQSPKLTCWQSSARVSNALSNKQCRSSNPTCILTLRVTQNTMSNWIPFPRDETLNLQLPGSRTDHKRLRSGRRRTVKPRICRKSWKNCSIAKESDYAGFACSGDGIRDGSPAGHASKYYRIQT